MTWPARTSGWGWGPEAPAGVRGGGMAASKLSMELPKRHATSPRGRCQWQPARASSHHWGSAASKEELSRRQVPRRHSLRLPAAVSVAVPPSMARTGLRAQARAHGPLSTNAPRVRVFFLESIFTD